MARADRHVWLIEPDAATRGLIGRPDVAVIDRNATSPGTHSPTATATVGQPTLLGV